MSTAATSTKHKAVAFYAAAWVGVLLAGSVGLMGLRQWGWSRIETEREQAMFEKVCETFDSGDVIQAQKRLVTLLELKPDRLEMALETLGSEVLALPVAVQSMIDAAPNVALPPEHAARQSVLLEDGEAALHQLASLSEGDRDVMLLRARLLVEHGEFEDARDLFDSYWAGQPGARLETVEQLTPAASELESRASSAAEALFMMGLWGEAADVAASGGAAAATDPGLGFYAAAAAERDASPEDALQRYEGVLKEFPNHGRALQRYATLERKLSGAP